MKKIFNFALYDFANSAFTTIIITFIFATYFAKQIAPNPVMGQSYWGWTIGITGFLVAIIGPIVGSFADRKNKIVFFVRCFSLLCILFTALLWFAKPSQSYLLYTSAPGLQGSDWPAQALKPSVSRDTSTVNCDRHGQRSLQTRGSGTTPSLKLTGSG